MLTTQVHDVAVIGGGNGGLTLAGAVAARGHRVRLFNRSLARLQDLASSRRVRATGEVTWQARLDLVTDRLDLAVEGVSTVLVVTTADAHPSIALSLAPLLVTGQMIVLHPGRTGGALVFRRALAQAGCVASIIVAETQSLLFACRASSSTHVHIFGAKAHVPIAALPARDTPIAVARMLQLLAPFDPAPSVLHTSLENIGAVLHPALMLATLSRVERAEPFRFYHDVGRHAELLVSAVDQERIATAQAYGVPGTPVADWVNKAYQQPPGSSFLDRLRNNPAYSEIPGPAAVNMRYLTEDIPTGLVPFSALAGVAGIATPVTDSITTLASVLLQHDLRTEGRTIENLGLKGLDVSQIMAHVE